MAHRTRVRRADGYAAAEKLVFDRNIELCFVEEGEVCCDTEVLIGLETSVFTVTASTACEVYYLNLKCYEKLVLKRNPQTINLIKMLVETKLLGRKSTIPGCKIELLPLLLYRLRFVRHVSEQTDDTTGSDVKTLHRKVHERSQDFDLNHKVIKNDLEPKDSASMVMDWYKKNKAPLLKPVTGGAVYYKEMMHRRAKDREDIRKKFSTESDVCKAISRRVKDVILKGIKEGIKTEKMLQKVQLRWTRERAMAKWK